MKARVLFLLFMLSIRSMVFAQPGSIDTGFHTGSGANNIVQQLELLSGDRIFAAGNFTTFNTATVRRVVRLLNDGRNDTSYKAFVNPGGVDGPVRSSCKMSDDRVLIGGLFIAISGVSSKNMGRIDTSGVVDSTTFVPGFGFNNEVLSLATHGNRIFAAGFFSSYNGVTKPGFTSIDINGGQDTTFLTASGFLSINAIAVTPSGQVYITGGFTSYNGITVNRIARLNVNGTLDNLFNPGSGPNSVVNSIRLQPDGKILIGGTFTSYNGTAINRIARINTDGTLDTSFNVGSGVNSNVRTISIQPNGKVIIGGDFTSYNGVTRARIARIMSNGALDTTFQIGAGVNGTVYASLVQSDGKLVFAGAFTEFDAIPVGRIIRLNGDACSTPDTPTVSVSMNPVKCPGGQTTLTVTGGNLYDPSANWYWYEDDCMTTPIDTGLSVTVSPTRTRTYYAKGISVCATGPCREITIQVSDTSKPIPSVHPLPTLSHTCSVTLTPPSAYDSCVGTVYGTTSNAITYSTNGTHQVIWNYSDGNGNSATQTQQVVINDTLAPVPDSSSLPTVHASCAMVISVFPKATDNCKGKVTATTNDSLKLDTPGTYTINWRYTDGNNNVSTQQQQFVIHADTLPPVPDSILPVLRSACSVQITQFPKATDACKGKITATTTDTLYYTAEGQYQITWNYNDGNGNISNQTQQIIIEDTVAPVPDKPQLSAVYGACAVTVVPPTATDNCVTSVTATTSQPLSYNQQGTYQITWTYSDGRGNSTTQTQQVVVDDTLPPIPAVAVLPVLHGSCAVQVNTIPTAYDSCSGWISATTSDSLFYNRNGYYTIHWNYTDTFGNIITQTQSVVILDTIAPAPVISSLPEITGACMVQVTSAPQASDNCDGLITATTTDTLSYRSPGVYTLHWTYRDKNGNSSNQNQTIRVLDTLAPVPVLANLPVLSASCNLTVTQIPIAMDQCKGAITASTSNPLTYSQRGTYTITWIYNDSNGNSSSQTQTVNITGLDKSIRIDSTGSPSTYTLSANYTSNTVTYLWFGCLPQFNPILTATARTFSPTTSGSYGVILNDSGCSDTTGCVSVTQPTTGFDNTDFSSGIRVYPIPTSDHVYIESESQFNQAVLRLYQINGKRILESTLESVRVFQVDMRTLDAGMYLCEIEENGKVNRYKIVKQ